MSGSAKHIEALTSLRFFAALLVVLFHHGQAQFTLAPVWLQNVIKAGYIGVPFFFVLSGFILAYNYAPQVQAKTLDPRRFWVARFARIYPVYAVSLIISAPLFMATLARKDTAESPLSGFGLHAFANFALIQSWIPPWTFLWNGPSWSLSVEAFFYLLFPVLIVVLSPRRRCQALVAFVLLGMLLVMLRLLVPPLNVIAAAQKILGWANPLLWLPLFLSGICTAERHLQSRQISDQRVPRGPWVGTLTLAVVGLILVAMAANLQRFSQLLYCYAVTPLCALLIYLMAREGNWLGQLLSRKPLILMGEASYSLYILHRPIHDWFAWLKDGGSRPRKRLAAFCFISRRL